MKEAERLGNQAANLATYAEMMYQEVISMARDMAFLRGDTEAAKKDCPPSPNYPGRPLWWDYLSDEGRILVERGERMFGKVE
jgi:hypothetical protein